MDKKYTKLASKEIVERTKTALLANGISAEFVESGIEAKKKVLELIPEGAEVMNMTSITLDTIGVAKEITQSGKYNSVRNKLNTMDRKTQSLQMQKLGSAPEWTVGSVHAVTEDGKVLIASNTGSQLAAYAYTSPHVLWIVGTQKIVKNTDEGIKRIYEYALPKETDRFRKAYNMPETFHSNVSKLLIINKEINPTRLHIIFVNEVLGF